MREVLIRPRAQLDIESIYLYLAVERGLPQAAQDIVDDIFAAFGRVADFPETGRLIADEALERDYRRTLVRDYWVYYTHDDSTLTVWRVIHTRRDVDNYALVDL